MNSQIKIVKSVIRFLDNLVLGWSIRDIQEHFVVHWKEYKKATCCSLAIIHRSGGWKIKRRDLNFLYFFFQYKPLTMKSTKLISVLRTNLPAFEFGGNNWRPMMPWRIMLTRPISADTMEIPCILWGCSSRVLLGTQEFGTGSPH